LLNSVGVKLSTLIFVIFAPYCSANYF